MPDPSPPSIRTSTTTTTATNSVAESPTAIHRRELNDLEELDVIGPGAPPTLLALGEQGGGNVGGVENSSTSSRQVEADDQQQRVLLERDPQALEREYATNAFTLAFEDPETELRYTQFIYVHSGFYGGKLWHLMNIFATSTFMFLYHPQGKTAGLTLLTDTRLTLCNITVFTSVIMLILTLQERFCAYREHFLLVSLGSHWPALATLVTLAKKPQPIAYAICLSCYFFCAFISQIRFCRLFPFLTITPVLTLIILVTTQPGYFDRHAITELAFWPSVLFPIMLLRVFETLGRRSFHVVEKCERRVEELELKIEMAQQTIANFFPPTPTVDLLVRQASTMRANSIFAGGGTIASFSNMPTTTMSINVSQHQQQSQSKDKRPGVAAENQREPSEDGPAVPHPDTTSNSRNDDDETEVEMAEMFSVTDSDSCSTPNSAWSVDDISASNSASATRAVPRHLQLRAPASRHQHHHRVKSSDCLKTCMIYSNAAMIVTDLAGFTQWTSSCAQDPSMVITLLTKMFLTIDKLMPLYKVEKVATVGDAFIGVIFDDSPNLNHERRGLRALHAIQFGCSILAAASSEVTGLSPESSLKMRVGVHLGEFVGGFVGTAPPKFDCFGDGFDKVKTMESTGRPDAVHISSEALGAALSWEKLYENDGGAKEDVPSENVLLEEFFGKCGATGDCERTEQGVLCKRWPGLQNDGRRQSSPRNAAKHAVLVADQAVVDLDADDDVDLLVATEKGDAEQDTPFKDPPLGSPRSPRGGGAKFLLGDPHPTVVDTQYNEIVRDSAIDICETLVMMRHSRDLRGTAAAHSNSQPANAATNPLQGSASNTTENAGLPMFVSFSPSNQKPNRGGLAPSFTIDDETTVPPQVADATEGNEARTNSEDSTIDINGKKKDPYDFHFIFLEFFNKQTERQYLAALLSGNLLTTSYFIMGLLELMLVVAHSMNACLDTVENRLLLGACVSSNALWLGVTHHFGIGNVKTAMLVIACAHLNLAASYFSTSDCGNRGADLGTADIAVSYFVVASMSTEFALVFSLKSRVVLNIMTVSFTYALHLTRVAFVIGEDEAFRYDWNLFAYGATIATHLGVSFLIDFTQRSSFASTRKLRRLLVSTRGKHADVATKAMEIMLPAFVTEELTSSGKKEEKSHAKSEGDEDGDHSENSRLIGGGASVTNTFRGSSKVVDLEVLRDGMVWEYQSVVVMFISFTPAPMMAKVHPGAKQSPEKNTDDPGTTNGDKHLLEQYHRINTTIVRLEKILLKHDVQKVKTIGNVMLAVAGIDNETIEPHRKIFNAALQIQKELSSQRRVDHVSIGIHSGACFGAVIGVKGLCFDIFGDTVNTASRMCSTAMNGAIQVTDATRMTALASNQVPSKSLFQSIDEPVLVKGKGMMVVYQLVGEQ